MTHCDYCGVLDWTVERYKRPELYPFNVVHKHGCANRRDGYCQTHPEGCPESVDSGDES